LLTHFFGEWKTQYAYIYISALLKLYIKWVQKTQSYNLMRSWIQATEMSFLQRVARLTLRDRVGSLIIREDLKVVTAPSHWKEPVEVVGAFGQDAFQMLPCWGVSDLSHREEASGQTQDLLERQYLSAGSGMTQCPKKCWRRWLGRGRSGVDCCPHDPDPDKKQKMDRWMNYWYSIKWSNYQTTWLWSGWVLQSLLTMGTRLPVPTIAWCCWPGEGTSKVRRKEAEVCWQQDSTLYLNTNLSLSQAILLLNRLHEKKSTFSVIDVSLNQARVSGSEKRCQHKVSKHTFPETAAWDWLQKVFWFILVLAILNNGWMFQVPTNHLSKIHRARIISMTKLRIHDGRPLIRVWCHDLWRLFCV